MQVLRRRRGKQREEVLTVTAYQTLEMTGSKEASSHNKVTIPAFSLNGSTMAPNDVVSHAISPMRS